MYIPNIILQHVEGQQYTENTMGQSGAKVLIFPDYVLKIQDKSAESDNEIKISTWLQGRVPIPQVVEYCEIDQKLYVLMSRFKGKLFCDKEYLSQPKQLVKMVADALQKLWSVDLLGSPGEVSRLEHRLEAAKCNVENGLIDFENVEPETFGVQGFADAEELLHWLQTNQPAEDVVLTHGDFCLNNVFAKGNDLGGFIDIGKMGPADRWQDIAILLRDLKGYLADDFEPEMLLNELGIEMDEEKENYYRLLDELF